MVELKIITQKKQRFELSWTTNQYNLLYAIMLLPQQKQFSKDYIQHWFCILFVIVKVNFAGIIPLLTHFIWTPPGPELDVAGSLTTLECPSNGTEYVSLYVSTKTKLAQTLQ